MVDAALISEPPLLLYSQKTCTILHIPNNPQII